MTVAFIDPLDKIMRRRRSIRKYKADMPQPGWIETIIECAAMAPSPSNTQPVRYVRIQSPEKRGTLHRTMIERHRELLDKVRESGAPKKARNLINVYYRYSDFMFDAPVLLAVGTVIETRSFSGKLVEANIMENDARGETDLDISVGLALKGLLLKCEALGLGSCILTAPLVFVPDADRILGLEDIRVKCFVTVGFPDETPPRVERKGLAEVYREI